MKYIQQSAFFSCLRLLDKSDNKLYNLGKRYHIIFSEWLPIVKITLKQVSEVAGVSSATAARVLGNYGYVSDEKRILVLEAAKKLNYHPHFLAKSLVTGETKTVGFVVGDIENPFFASLAKWINTLLSIQGYTLMVYSTDENIEEETRGIDTLIAKQVDGIIIAPASYRDYSHIVAAQNAGIAVVTIDRVLSGLAFDSISVDNTRGMFEATQYLIQHGHRDIGFLSDSLEISSNLDRLTGYRKALAKSKLPYNDDLICVTGFSVMDGYRGAVSMLGTSKRPTALVTASNLLTTGLLLAIRDLSIKVPEQISLISFDDMDWYLLTDPPITAVSQPIKRIGQETVRLLFNRLTSKGEPGRHETVQLPTRLIHRCSTKQYQ